MHVDYITYTNMLKIGFLVVFELIKMVSFWMLLIISIKSTLYMFVCMETCIELATLDFDDCLFYANILLSETHNDFLTIHFSLLRG